MQIVIFTILTLTAFLLLTVAYVLSHALLGRWFGVCVVRVAVGHDVFGKCLFEWQGRHWTWRVGLLPIGGYVKFKNIEDENAEGDLSATDGKNVDTNTELPPDSFEAAGKIQRLGVMFIGPLVHILLGIILLAVPILQESGQLNYAPAQANPLSPSAIPGLVATQDAASWSRNWDLCSNVGLQFVQRFLLFQPLDGWGGFCGWMVTGGAAGAYSVSLWLTYVGLIAVLNGCLNLLPLGGLSGSHVVWVLLESLYEQDKARNIFTVYSLISVLFLFATCCIRVIYADVIWIIRLWW